jgi:hypothetical protein
VAWLAGFEGLGGGASVGSLMAACAEGFEGRGGGASPGPGRLTAACEEGLEGRGGGTAAVVAGAAAGT